MPFPLTELHTGPGKRNTPALENIQMLVESAPRTTLGMWFSLGSHMDKEGRESGNKQAGPVNEDQDENRKIRRLQIIDRKSTRLNSSHPSISYAVFCLKKKKKK